ncbi:major facilitator superfamily domain-containing protein [Fusarium acuminatum]|uniref:Major facilitator superfamily domain-containing protein n=1 Tax=Fusarium acuminatum TaxID=5515 RepID=A0ABZ2WY92_9HYPO
MDYNSDREVHSHFGPDERPSEIYSEILNYGTSPTQGLTDLHIAASQLASEDTIDPSNLHTGHYPEVYTETSNVVDELTFVPANSNSTGSVSAPFNLLATSEAPAPTPPKYGRRLSLNSVRILNKWLSNNTHHPYPSVQDVEALERQSGLSRKQILNWFANARRRNKFTSQDTTDQSSVSSDTSPRNIPIRRPATPSVQQTPFDRWRNSPPEDEPSSMEAIARALSGALEDAPSSSRPRHRPSSTVTSAQTSDSSRSSRASAYSHGSDGSLESLRKMTKKRRRGGHRRRNIASRDLSQACHRFQCTFCTETFKLKHTWLRHERTQHLSLEQWECSPSGPTVLNQHCEPVCVYCGMAKPGELHFETHNHDLCHNRERGERTFFRKDHLRQHLRLVHRSEFMKWPMEEWKLKHEDVLSRCGFCDVDMTTWSERGNHLAWHFKEGSTMADWKGNWGFDAATLEMVENSMPPYLIDYERNSPLPFSTQQGAPYSSTSAFELLQLELDYFYSDYVDVNHCIPSDKTLHLEACCIIFGAEMCYPDMLPTASSWLRDLLMGTDEITTKARMTPMKSAARSRFTELRIHSKKDIFEDCKLEASLRQYIDMLKLLNLDIGDNEVQQEACSIINQMPNASPMFVNLLTTLVYGSTHWLRPFRLRTGLPPSKGNPLFVSPHDSASLSTAQISTGILDENTTHQPLPGDKNTGPSPSQFQHGPETSTFTERQRVISLNDGNMYRGLTRELTRYVARTISPLNPTSHLPTDEELQYQARWIEYDR